MSKNIELNIACYNLMRAIKSGNRVLTNADYNKKWDDFNRRNQKLKNLRRKA